MRLVAAYYGQRRITSGWLGAKPLDLRGTILRLYGSVNSAMALGDVLKGSVTVMRGDTAQSHSVVGSLFIPVAGKPSVMTAGGAIGTDRVDAMTGQMVQASSLESGGGHSVAGTAHGTVRQGSHERIAEGIVQGSVIGAALGNVSANSLSESVSGRLTDAVLADASNPYGTDVVVPVMVISAGASGSARLADILAKGSEIPTWGAASGGSMQRSVAAANESGTHGATAGGSPANTSTKGAADTTNAGATSGSPGNANVRGYEADSNAGAAYGNPFESTAKGANDPADSGVSPARLGGATAAADSIGQQSGAAAAQLTGDSATGARIALKDGSGSGNGAWSQALGDAVKNLQSDSAGGLLNDAAAATPIALRDSSSSAQALSAAADVRTLQPTNSVSAERTLDAILLGGTQKPVYRDSSVRGLDAAVSPVQRNLLPILGITAKMLGDRIVPLAREPTSDDIADKTDGSSVDALQIQALPHGISESADLAGTLRWAQPEEAVSGGTGSFGQHRFQPDIQLQVGGISAKKCGSDNVIAAAQTLCGGKSGSYLAGAFAAGEAQPVWAVMRDGWLIIRQAFNAEVSNDFLIIQ